MRLVMRGVSLTLQEGNLLLPHPLKSQVYRGLGVLKGLETVLRRTPLGECLDLGIRVCIVVSHDQFLE